MHRSSLLHASCFLLCILSAPACVVRIHTSPTSDEDLLENMGPGSLVSRQENRDLRIAYYDEGQPMLARVRGPVTLDLAAQEEGWVRLEPDGLLELHERRDGRSLRWIAFRADARCEVTRSHHLEGAGSAADAAAQAEFARTRLQGFVRNTPTGARAHARGVFARGGVLAVLEALDQPLGDAARDELLELALAQGDC